MDIETRVLACVLQCVSTISGSCRLVMRQRQTSTVYLPILCTHFPKGVSRANGFCMNSFSRYNGRFAIGRAVVAIVTVASSNAAVVVIVAKGTALHLHRAHGHVLLRRR